MFELNSNNAEFIQRHIGPNHDDTQKMLSVIGLKSVEELISKTVPDNIRSKKAMEIPAGLTEFEMLQALKKTGEKISLPLTLFDKAIIVPSRQV